MAEEGIKRKVVVGLDIGTTKIACIVGTQTEHGKVEIISMGKFESVGVTRGVVSNIEKTVHSIKAAVEQAKADIIAGKIVVHDYMADNNCPAMN